MKVIKKLLSVTTASVFTALILGTGVCRAEESCQAITPEAITVEPDAIIDGRKSVNDFSVKGMDSVYNVLKGVTPTGNYYDQLDDNSKSIYRQLYEQYKEGPVKNVTVSVNMAPITVDIYIPDSSSNSFALTEESNEKLWKEVELELISARNALVYDHPELSWMAAGSGNMGFEDCAWTNIDFKTNTAVLQPKVVSYTTTSEISSLGGKLDTEIAEFKQKIQASLPENPSRYDIVFAIHKAVCNQVNYEGTSANIGLRPYQTIYSCFYDCDMDGKIETVCAGYSKLFKVMCNQFDIPCVLVAGTGIDSSGAGGSHMWNYVQMEADKWYAVDATWDDQSSIFTDYFLVGSTTKNTHFDKKAFSETHIPNPRWNTGDVFEFAYPELATYQYNRPVDISLGDVTITAGQTKNTLSVLQNGTAILNNISTDSGLVLTGKTENRSIAINTSVPKLNIQDLNVTNDDQAVFRVKEGCSVNAYLLGENSFVSEKVAIQGAFAIQKASQKLLLISGVDGGFSVADSVNLVIPMKDKMGLLFGRALLDEDYQIPEGFGITLEEGQTLELTTNAELDCSGSLVLDGGLLKGAGTVKGTGDFIKYQKIEDYSCETKLTYNAKTQIPYKIQTETKYCGKTFEVDDSRFVEVLNYISEDEEYYEVDEIFNAGDYTYEVYENGNLIATWNIEVKKAKPVIIANGYECVFDEEEHGVKDYSVLNVFENDMANKMVEIRYYEDEACEQEVDSLPVMPKTYYARLTLPKDVNYEEAVKVVCITIKEKEPDPTSTPTPTPTPTSTPTPTMAPTGKPGEVPGQTVEPIQKPGYTTETPVKPGQTDVIGGTKDSENLPVFLADSNGYYKIVSKEKRTVQFVKAKQKKSVVIPSYVVYDNTIYGVVSIGKNAFYGNKKVTSVKVPGSVYSIGTKTFYKVKTLKKITIQSTKLTAAKIGSKAFSGIYKKATFYLPSKKGKAYKKILLKKGGTKKMKYK